MRVRERLGIRWHSEWDAMPDNDKRDWLAFDWLKQKRVQKVLDMVLKRVDDGMAIEIQNLVTTELARWGM